MIFLLFNPFGVEKYQHHVYFSVTTYPGKVTL